MSPAKGPHSFLGEIGEPGQPDPGIPARPDTVGYTSPQPRVRRPEPDVKDPGSPVARPPGRTLRPGLAPMMALPSSRKFLSWLDPSRGTNV